MIGLMIFLFEAVTVFGRMKSMSVIRGMTSASRLINVKRYFSFIRIKLAICNYYRNGEWNLLSTEKLLPGDLISLAATDGDNTIPCDCLLLRVS
jgi:magnesium-transporting ATPase (P-type)